MSLKATFYSVTEEGEDASIGTVTLHGGKAVADPNKGFLADAARSINEWPNPEEAMKELPSMFKSAYLRASLDDDVSLQSSPLRKH